MISATRFAWKIRQKAWSDARLYHIGNGRWEAKPLFIPPRPTQQLSQAQGLEKVENML